MGVPLVHAVGKLQLPPMRQQPPKVPLRAQTELVSQLRVSTAAGSGREVGVRAGGRLVVGWGS